MTRLTIQNLKIKNKSKFGTLIEKFCIEFSQVAYRSTASFLTKKVLPGKNAYKFLH